MELVELYFTRLALFQNGESLPKFLKRYSKYGIENIEKIRGNIQMAKAAEILPSIETLTLTAFMFNDMEIVRLLEYKLDSVDQNDKMLEIYQRYYDERPRLKKIRRYLRRLSAEVNLERSYALSGFSGGLGESK